MFRARPNCPPFVGALERRRSGRQSHHVLRASSNRASPAGRDDHALGPVKRAVFDLEGEKACAVDRAGQGERPRSARRRSRSACNRARRRPAARPCGRASRRATAPRASAASRCRVSDGSGRRRAGRAAGRAPAGVDGPAAQRADECAAISGDQRQAFGGLRGPRAGARSSWSEARRPESLVEQALRAPARRRRLVPMRISGARRSVAARGAGTRPEGRAVATMKVI